MFDDIINKVIDLEGKYSNHPSDSGGRTSYGITEHVARCNGYEGAMRDMSMYRAKNIYRKAYWDTLRLTDIYAMNPSIAEELFDTGVNQGVSRAAEYLQRSLNGLNRQERDYKDIKVDGSIGKKTLAALFSYLNKRGLQGEIVMLHCLNSLQGAFYINLAETRQKDEDFLFGWMSNRVKI